MQLPSKQNMTINILVEGAAGHLPANIKESVEGAAEYVLS